MGKTIIIIIIINPELENLEAFIERRLLAFNLKKMCSKFWKFIFTSYIMSVVSFIKKIDHTLQWYCVNQSFKFINN